MKKKKEGTRQGWANLVAPYCATPRDYLSDTPLLRSMGFLVSQNGHLGAIPPSLSVSSLVRACEVEVQYPPPPPPPSGLKVRRAKSAAKNPKIIEFILGLWFFELDLMGWSARSATHVFHEGCQAQRMRQAVCIRHACPLLPWWHVSRYLYHIAPPHLT